MMGTESDKSVLDISHANISRHSRKKKKKKKRKNSDLSMISSILADPKQLLD